MDQSPLVTEAIEAGARFLEEFDKVVPVRAAFWLWFNEEDSPYLYITSNQIIDGTVATTYREVGRIAREFRDPHFDQFRIKLLKRDDQFAKAGIEFLERFNVKAPTRLRDRMFGGRWVEEICIYPNPVAVP
jgi:hypothetical protein